MLSSIRCYNCFNVHVLVLQTSAVSISLIPLDPYFCGGSRVIKFEGLSHDQLPYVIRKTLERC